MRCNGPTIRRSLWETLVERRVADTAYLMREQEPDDIDVAARGGQGEGGVVGHVAVLLVGAAAKDELHDLVAAAAARQRQRGVLRTLRLGFDVGAVV